jgi:hypothetical protein
MEPAEPLTTSRAPRKRVRPKSLVESARLALLVLALASALVYFLTVVHDHYPIQHWLFWVYAKLWGWCALFGLACLGAGHALVTAILPNIPLRERVVLALPTGCLAFFAAMFAGGLLGLYGATFAVGLPLIFVAAGSPSALRMGRRLWRHRALLRPDRIWRPRWWTYPAVVYGLGALGLVYFAILSPRNIAFDAHFYHLAIAQDYAVAGAITRSQIGWTPAALPHLASVLYTWCFLLPGFDFFQRITCAAHLEFVVFIWTLLGIPVLVRWLVPKSRVGASWVVLFLFPGILLYDSSLSVAADHVAALWAVPIFLTLRRAWRELCPRATILFAVMLSGALLTKYQGFYLMVFPVIALVGRAAWLGARPRGSPRWRPLVGLATAGGAGLVLTAPHWLKNWVWYGDPLFPLLHRHFEPTAWAPEAGRIFEEWSTHQTKDWVVSGSLWARLTEALKAQVSFSFEPHDWPKFHGEVPVFGSLFTLSLFALPFLRGTRRTWSLVAATQIGLFVWFWTLPQDRYLQILLPWMAAATAAAIALVWRTHVGAKTLMAALVGAQAVWGGDIHFIPGHAMTRKSPAVTSAELLAQGHKKNYDGRFALDEGLFQVGAELPADARVLLHEENRRLGLWRPVESDITGWQLALRYDTLESPAALHQRLRELGITHILTRPDKSRNYDTLGSDLRWFDYVKTSAELVKRYGTFTLYRLPTDAPRAARNDVVAYLGCGKYYGRGLHRLRDLTRNEKAPATARLEPFRAAPSEGSKIATIAAEADYLVVTPSCKPAVPRSVLADFVEVANRGREQLYVRRSSEERR